jgi:selenocysteine lyase/cysteine desulfurase
MNQSVIVAVVNHTRREAEIGGYEAAAEAADDINSTYDVVAAAIHAQRSEVALVENATRGWDMAFYAIPFKPGDIILTSMAEYGSNVIAFLQMRKRGVEIQVVPNDGSGQIDLGALAAMMNERVRVVAISHMPTNGGLLQPAIEIGKVVKDWPALYLLDACQTVGQMPIDVEAIGCDMLSATSRKYLRGPRGQGFLYVRDSVCRELEPPFLDNHAATWISRNEIEIVGDARRFENWERSYANILGLRAAVAHANMLGFDAIWEAVSDRARRLRSALSENPNVMIQDIGEVQGGIVTFTHRTLTPQEIKAGLAAEHINVSNSSVFSTRFDMESRGLDMVVRASVHYLTTDDEIDRLVSALP